MVRCVLNETGRIEVYNRRDLPRGAGPDRQNHLPFFPLAEETLAELQKEKEEIEGYLSEL